MPKTMQNLGPTVSSSSAAGNIPDFTSGTISTNIVRANSVFANVVFANVGLTCGNLSSTGTGVVNANTTYFHVANAGAAGLRISAAVAGQESSIGFWKDATFETAVAGDNWVIGKAAWGAGATGLGIGCNQSGAVMSLTPAGRVGLGTTGPSERLHVMGNAYIQGNAFVTGAIVAMDDITAFSDVHLKTDLHGLDDAVHLTRRLTGYTYSRIDTGSAKRYAGLVAQEVQAVLPEAVRTCAGGTLAVSYNGVVALLVQSVKELAARVDALEQNA